LLGFCLFVMLPSSTETAIANGDTRTIRLYHAHTGESIEATYRVDGHYDSAVLAKLNWFLRDWRRNEETNMDPRLIDAVWETYRAAGASQPIVVLCGYRSPQTNSMLRHRSRGVAEHSQHILGKAMDTTMPGLSMEKVREIAMRLQRGGVGYYPSSNFVHIDVGGVRAWPRMSYDQLVRLFPDGKTVHIAADGRTLPGYEEARAEIEADGGSASVPPPANGGNFFAWLFGMGSGGEDEHEDAAGAVAARTEPAGETYVAEASSGKAAPDDDAPAVVAERSESPAADAEKSADDNVRAGVAERSEKPTADAEKSTDDDPPVPPRRPIDLASVADIPVPPLRRNDQMAMLLPANAQGEMPKEDQIGNLIATGFPARAPASPARVADSAARVAGSAARAPDLPGIITEGPKDGRSTQSLSRSGAASQGEALAYAPMAQMEGLRSAAHEQQAAAAPSRVAEDRPGIVPARLDRSNFRSLTEATETAEMESQTIFGPTLAGLRKAARVETAALSERLESGYLARFGVEATDLAADRFSGPSVASLDADTKLMVFVDSSAARENGD
jgi:uncharacterized protein YcbK (DUF882 family)